MKIGHKALLRVLVVLSVGAVARWEPSARAGDDWPKELAGGYIENVLNIDFYSETFRDELDKLDKDKTYLIYCRSGNRSGKALDIMAELNFREAYNMLGGIIEWNAEGLPTVK